MHGVGFSRNLDTDVPGQSDVVMWDNAATLYLAERRFRVAATQAFVQNDNRRWYSALTTRWRGNINVVERRLKWGSDAASYAETGS